MKVIALEEHFATAEVMEAWQQVEPRWSDLALKDPSGGEIPRKLLDFGAERVKAMDEAGVDVSVLSLTSPAVQNLEAEVAVRLARASNDRLAEAVRARPDRLQGFATLPTPDAKAAAKELERGVRELGLQGAMLHGRTRDRNLSDAEFWPIFEVADALRAPLYLHPQSPQRGVLDAYYAGLGEEIEALFGRPGIGWHYETGVQILRMILAGVFDRFPNLQIVTGHWGEVVLFYLERIELLRGVAKLPRKISEYWQQQVSVTASGIYSQRYLQWSLEVLGEDRVMFATDYPFGRGGTGSAREFMESAKVSDAVRGKIASGNWERLVAGIRR